MLQCMSLFLARTGPTGPVWRCPIIGVDRKWHRQPISVENDPSDIGWGIVSTLADTESD
jgi:hypothetical protein